MMGLFSQAGSHIRRARGSSVEDRAPEDTEPDDTSILSVSSIPCPPSWATLVLTLTTETRMRAPSSRPSYPSSGASSLAPPLVLLTDATRVGMDLSKVTFPTFVLEPRSMLERITDFMSHPDLIFGCVPLCSLSSSSSVP